MARTNITDATRALMIIWKITGPIKLVSINKKDINFPTNLTYRTEYRNKIV